MPELPEVETVRRGLAPYLEGATLRDVHLHRRNLRYDFPVDFAQKLEGATVLRLERRAKYLLAWLDTQQVWVTHLGMTGRFQVSDDAFQTELDGSYYHAVAADMKHRHVDLQAVQPSGGAAVRIDYHDARRFGFMLLMSPDALYASTWFKGLGVEPLSDDLDARYLLQRAQGRKVNLKAFLMAQGMIAGLGNIYVCEALWRARLSPDHRADTLTQAQAEALVGSIKAVLGEAIAAGGSSISDFAAASGELGYFQHRFNVYDRKGQPCARGDGGVINRAVHQGRSSFYCPVCQT